MTGNLYGAQSADPSEDNHTLGNKHLCTQSS